MKHLQRSVVLAATCAALLAGATTGAAGASQPQPDLVDCGSDRRDWFDAQPDVDYPSPPPEELEPTLEAAGCPSNGEPCYGPGPFDPRAPSCGGAANPTNDSDTLRRRRSAKRCKSGRRGKRARPAAPKLCGKSGKRASTPR